MKFISCIRKISVILFAVVLFQFQLNAQSIKIEKDYFRSPLDIPLKLAGNFAEIRQNHFHSGIDIKTDSVEGKNVYAIADGFIVRIKVSATGFGNALYINHPNGTTSVYGHLQRFNDSIAQYVYNTQIEKQSFEIDETPDSNLFIVRKGDIIALSGNSGSSSGPHLHFEIRNTKTENIMNPQLFGFIVKDSIPPVIKSLSWYEDKMLRNSDSVIQLNPSTYSLRDTLKVTRNARFGFTAYDLSDDALNKLGIYDAKFFINDSLIWQYRFDEFSFDETRYVNAHIDYNAKVNFEKTIERCYKLPNNNFSVFKIDSVQYKPAFQSRKIYEGRLVLTDVSGNQSDLLFYFKQARPVSPVKKEKEWVALSPARPYRLKTEKIYLQIPQGALYDNIYFKYHITKKVKPLLSQIHHINDAGVPLHKSAAISIKAPKVKQQYFDKLCIVSIDANGIIDYEGGLYKNGFVSTTITSLGSYAIDIDTLSPYIINMQPALSSFKNDTVLSFQLHDNISGIKSWKVEANDKWILASYDLKNYLLKIQCRNFTKGENRLKITATDKRNNTGTFETIIMIE